MGDTAYELLALGLRYWFVLLLFLTLLRAFWLMQEDRREYNRALRRLPDAGLIGEVVELSTGKSQPLPREGLIGSGRGCDIRLPKLHRREMEFVFRPGLGLKLIPIHRKHRSILDGEPLNKADSYALHGTVLELRGYTLRFRLFAGLDLPYREPLPDEVFIQPDHDSFSFDSSWDAVPPPVTFYPHDMQAAPCEPGHQYSLPEEEYYYPPQEYNQSFVETQQDAFIPGDDHEK